jgi:hypothetical protein
MRSTRYSGSMSHRNDGGSGSAHRKPVMAKIYSGVAADCAKILDYLKLSRRGRNSKLDVAVPQKSRAVPRHVPATVMSRCSRAAYRMATSQETKTRYPI